LKEPGLRIVLLGGAEKEKEKMAAVVQQLNCWTTI
jgi:hypothetical protein